MKFLDLFAGIGGFRLGMESAGHECIGFCEIDKFARASYKAIHNTEGEIELHDITTVSDDTIRGIGHIDVICGGFPCQAFSIAGARRGFEDTRGTLFGNTKNPNGTGQGTGSRVYDLSGLVGTLSARDYKEPKQVAIPVGRESQSISSQSVIKIGNVNPSGNGMNGEVYSSQGLAPTLTTNKGEGQKIAIPVLTPDRANKRQNGRRFKTDGEPMFTLTAQDRHGVVVENKVKQVGNLIDTESFGGNPHRGRVYDIRGISPCLNCMGGGGREPKIRVKEATKQGYAEAEIGDSVNLSHPNSKTRRGRVSKQIANTLLTGETQGVVEPDFRIRKLTPLECWRLQGFPDCAFDKAQEVNSNSQLYKQAGNSVTVNVIAAIAKELK